MRTAERPLVQEWLLIDLMMVVQRCVRDEVLQTMRMPLL